MAKIIRDFWIILDTGIVIFSRVYEQKVHDDLLGGLMSVLDTFARRISDGALSHIEFSNKSLCLFKSQSIIFVASYLNKVEDQEISEELNLVSETFFNTFPAGIFYNFNGNTAIFNDFGDSIKSSLSDLNIIFHD